MYLNLLVIAKIVPFKYIEIRPIHGSSKKLALPVKTLKRYVSMLA
jgi:hypothetical protein